MITATILTKNNQKTLQKTLDCLTRFPEVIVLDSGSSDNTLKIAESYPNVKIHKGQFLGFGPMHNWATELASNDWILSIDSDEVPSPALLEEIFSIALDPKTVYSLPRHNYFNGKWIKWCGGWHPDFVKRLYNRKATRFTEDFVHETIVDKGLQVQKLKGPLLHTPYLEIRDFLDKMQIYSDLYAKQRPDKKGSVFQAIIHGWYAFIKSYIFKRGFLGGKEGFIISMYNGHSAFYKYLKLCLRK